MITTVITRTTAMAKALTVTGSMSMKGMRVSAAALAVYRAPDRAVRLTVQHCREPFILNGDAEITVM